MPTGYLPGMPDYQSRPVWRHHFERWTHGSSTSINRNHISCWRISEEDGGSWVWVQMLAWLHTCPFMLYVCVCVSVCVCVCLSLHTCTAIVHGTVHNILGIHLHIDILIFYIFDWVVNHICKCIYVWKDKRITWFQLLSGAVYTTQTQRRWWRSTCSWLRYCPRYREAPPG